MPASPDSPDRPGGRLLPALLWAGVGIAPLAALALLVGSGEQSLRVAIGLALLAMVLIGLSIALRPAVESIKVDLEDTLYDEVDVVREDMRNDIATAARATHRSFVERFEQLRGQLEALRAEVARQSPHSPHAPSHAAQPHPAGPVPAGVVRHTETVQVTTRSTVVDPHAEEPHHAGRDQAWAGQAPPRRTANVYGSPVRPEPAPSYEESWTEQQLRKRLADADAARNAPAAPAGHSSQAPDDAERWSRMRAGDRWASLRSDEHGRELRMGERRASMHADESGAEVRYEDRWASIRRDDDRRWPPDPIDERGAYSASHREPAHRDDHGARDWDEVRDWDAREAGWEGRDGNRPRALRATSDQPSAADWVNQWPAPPPEPERRRRYADEGY
jgi:hypothetical protein